MWPTWFFAGFALFLIVIVALRFRYLVALWRRTKDNPGSLDDEWDPFS